MAANHSRIATVVKMEGFRLSAVQYRMAQRLAAMAMGIEAEFLLELREPAVGALAGLGGVDPRADGRAGPGGGIELSVLRQREKLSEHDGRVRFALRPDNHQASAGRCLR